MSTTQTNPSDLLSARDVASVLGVRPQDVWNARRRDGRIPRLGDFQLPEPWAIVGGVPIWHRGQFGE